MWWIVLLVWCGWAHGALLEHERAALRAERSAAGMWASKFQPPQPPMVVDIPTSEEFFAFLKSPAFAEQYWETLPVLIRTNNAFDAVLSLQDDVLAGEYLVRGNKRNPPYRNVRFVPSAFHREAAAASSLGYADGATVGGAELRRALATNRTLQLYGAQAWWPRVGELCLNLSRASGLPTNVNVYITPGGLAVSLPAHNDFTCNFMVQLHGRKRWRLWKVPEFWLPTDERLILGRDEDEPLSTAELGEPLLDVVLSPGDVLYVPRGCFHATATVGEDGPFHETSMHLTTQAAALYDEDLAFTWLAFLGGDARFPHPTLSSGLQAALATLATRDPRVREGLPMAAPAGAWRARARALMHAAVDVLFDEGAFVDTTIAAFRASVERFRKDLRAKIKAAPPQAPRTAKSPDSTRAPHAQPSTPSAPSRPTTVNAAPSAESSASAPTATPIPSVSSSSVPSSSSSSSNPPPTPSPSDYQQDDLPSMPVPVAAALYSAVPDALRAQCVAEAASGECRQLLATRSRRKEQAVIVKVFNRPHLFSATIEDLCLQTVPMDIFVWNNNVAPDVRTRFEVLARAISCPMIRTVWLHHSPANVYQGEYVFASAISEWYESIIFLDDDAETTPNVVAQLASEARQFPNTILSTWALNFETFSSYWMRTMPPVHAEARYCGSAQMVAPAALFSNLTRLLDAFPARYRSVSDLWFNAFAVLEMNATLRRSAAPIHATRAQGDYDAGTALSTLPGMRELKTEFMQHLSRQHSWPFVGEVGEYNDVAGAAKATAARGALAASVRQFEIVVRSWPHYSKAWNNLGVVLLRMADGMPRDDARRAVLQRARDAFTRAASLPDQRDEALVARNLKLVDQLMSEQR